MKIKAKRCTGTRKSYEGAETWNLIEEEEERKPDVFKMEYNPRNENG